MSAAVTAFAPFIRSDILLFCERQAIETINCYGVQHQNENHIFVLLATLGTYTNVKSECIKKKPETQKTQQYMFIIRGQCQETVFVFTCVVFLYLTQSA